MSANDAVQIEKQFAVKVVQHMQTYWSILERVKGSSLRLTKFDDEIYEHLKRDFPDFDPAETIDEDKMKSKEGKEKWRNFMMAYEKKVNDYNFGTMLRANPKWEYGKDETIFGRSTLLPGHEKKRMLTMRSSKNAVLRSRDCEVIEAEFTLSCLRGANHVQKQIGLERLDLRASSEG